MIIFTFFSGSCKKRELGVNDKALEELNREYNEFKKTNGQGPSAYAFVDRYDSLSSRFYEAGDLHKAIECEKVMLEIFTQIWDEPVPRVAFRQWSIGFLYREAQEYDSAVTYLNKAIKTIQNVEKFDAYTDSVNESILLGCYKDLALVYSGKGNRQKAIESLESLFRFQPLKSNKDKENAAVYLDLLAALYYKETHYDDAATYYEKALNLYEVICPDSTSLIKKTRENLIEAKSKIAEENGILSDDLPGFVFVITCKEGDTPARQQGMSGEYILLEFADWNLNSKTSLYEKNKEMTNQPIDIVIMRDHVVEKHHFEDKVGIDFHLKEIGKDERDRVNTEYKLWKSKNN